MTEPEVETDLPDLSGVSLEELRARDKALRPYRAVVLAQVERPRVNLGSGPPGRAD